MPNSFPYIVADIGGTNSRFGLVTDVIKDFNTGSYRYEIAHKQKYPSHHFLGIEPATQHYIDHLTSLKINKKSISGACLAVAGPVAGDHVRLTNLNWDFSTQQVQQTLGFNKLNIINDFAAYANATPFVSEKNLLTLNKGQPLKGAPIVVVGPGTGFGLSYLIPTSDSLKVIAAEGGQISLSAKTALQANILNILSKEISHITVESIISGSGLCNLYRSLAIIEGLSLPPLAASQITEQALQDKNSLSYRVLRLFCLWLGQISGDLALTLGARGGVILGGGILKRIKEFLLASEFMLGFTDKGKMHDYCSKIPVKLITEDNSALVGAAAWYYEQH